MTELIEQVKELRSRALVLRQGDWSDGGDDAMLMEEAADTIESLRGRLQAYAACRVYVVEAHDELLEGPYIEPTCYLRREDAIRRVQSQTYTDGDGVRHWAEFTELRMVGA